MCAGSVAWRLGPESIFSHCISGFAMRINNIYIQDCHAVYAMSSIVIAILLQLPLM